MHSALQYAKDIQTGKIVSCAWVRLAVERHFNDLKRDFEYYFDETAADDVLEFFSFLQHSKGEWAGQIFELEPWQIFQIYMLFGWKHKETGMRRFRTFYLECARKQGKTTIAAGIGLYLMDGDDEPGAEIYAAAPLDLRTSIPIPSGWTIMGKIKVGDKVFSDKGDICTVKYMSPIFKNRQCYEIEFCDGEKIIADEDHRWEVTTVMTLEGGKGSTTIPKLRCEDGRNAIFSLHNKKYHVCVWRDPDKNEKFKIKLNELLKQNPLRRKRLSIKTAVRTTREILQTLIYTCKDRKLFNHSIKIAAALKTKKRKLPIDPYTLGVWLGDGRNNRGSIAFHKDDQQIADIIQSNGYKLSYQNPLDPNLLAFTPLGLTTDLRVCGLLDNKHIPSSYLRGSISQRTELLKGLMDSDGTCTKTGECRFSNRVKKLALAVRELVLSLGIKSHFREVEVTGSPHYYVAFKAYDDFPVFNLDRKRKRQISQLKTKTKNLLRTIRKITPVDSVPVRCIEVDSKSHLYLVSRSFIPTHNTKFDQAKLCHVEAERMVKSSIFLKDHLAVHVNNIFNEYTNSFFRPLGRDHDSLDGLNTHGCIIDEVHAHKTRDLWDVIETSTGARRQSLIFAITTAGFNRQTLCFELHDHTKKILEGGITDDTFLGFIYTIDEGDDWEDERLWIKSNPNLLVSVKLDDLQAKAKRAKEIPSALNSFLRLHLNVWTESETRWIPQKTWMRCAEACDLDSLKGQLCYGGLDLSSNKDITAFVLCFPPTITRINYIVLCRFFIPKSNMTIRVHNDRVHYDVWERQGLLTATPGTSIDYAYIINQIGQDVKDYDLAEIAFDRWGATKIVQDLADLGFEKPEDNPHAQRFLIPFGQGYVSMNAPMKELENLILAGKISHGGNPVLAWMASNVIVSQDAANNIKPDKSKSIEKIDGIISLIMSLDRAIKQEHGKKNESMPIFI